MATRAEVENALAHAIDAESKVGLRWSPGSEMAAVVYRRWESFSRRHRIKKPTLDQRIHDLAKGLQAHFEPGVPWTPLSEYLHLATLLAKVLGGTEM